MPFPSQAQRAGRRMGKWGKKRPFWFSRGWKRIAVGLWDTLTCFPSISFWRKSMTVIPTFWPQLCLLPHPLVLINKFLRSDTQTSFLHVFAHPDCLNQMHVKPRFFHLPRIGLHIPLSYRPLFLWGASSVWPSPGRTQSSFLPFWSMKSLLSLMKCDGCEVTILLFRDVPACKMGKAVSHKFLWVLGGQIKVHVRSSKHPWWREVSREWSIKLPLFWEYDYKWDIGWW